MSLVIFVSLVSCALGALLVALARSRSWLDGPVRTFAIGAGLALVLTHLIPESARALGAWALVAIGAGLALPWWVRKRRGAVATDLAYAGLLGYHVFEAARMTIAARGAPTAELTLALVAHSMPTTALVLVSSGGALAARAVGLAIASALGVVAASLGAESLAMFAPAGDGIAAGLLLFAVVRAIGPEGPVRWGRRIGDLGGLALWGRRIGDLGGLALGVAVTLVGTRAHWDLATSEAHALELRLAEALLDTTLEAAPMLLLGLALGALVQALGGTIPERWVRAETPLRDALRGAVIGAPIPVCACGILPVAEGLAARRASAAMVVAFLLATPQAGVETFALMARFLGVPFAAAHLIAALVTSIVAAVVIGHRVRPAAITIGGRRFELAAPPRVASCADGCCDHDHASSSKPEGLAMRWGAAFDELVLHNAPWALAGIVLAALIAELVPSESVASFAAIGADVPLMALLAVPAYVCPASAAPLGAVLIAKGLSPGAVLVAVTLGPATNVATLAFLRRRYGARALTAGVAALVGTAWLAALVVNAVVPVALPPLITGEEHGHGWAAWVATAVLALVVVRSLWLAGPVAVLPSTGHHAHP